MIIPNLQISHKRRDTVQAWVNAEELEKIKQAVAISGAKSVSTFVRENVLAIAEDINAQQNINAS